MPGILDTPKKAAIKSSLLTARYLKKEFNFTRFTY